jgi:CheY-like chemotaxis protein
MDRSSVTVLVVDDVDASRYAVTRALQQLGFRTMEASGGAGALELAGYVSAIVLDVHLPDLLGFEVCRLLRNNPDTASLPVIHISAIYVQGEDLETGADAGADAYFVAPVDPGELATTLDRLIAARPRP